MQQPCVWLHTDFVRLWQLDRKFHCYVSSAEVAQDKKECIFIILSFLCYFKLVLWKILMLLLLNFYLELLNPALLNVPFFVSFQVGTSSTNCKKDFHIYLWELPKFCQLGSLCHISIRFFVSHKFSFNHETTNLKKKNTFQFKGSKKRFFSTSNDPLYFFHFLHISF